MWIRDVDPSVDLRKADVGPRRAVTGVARELGERPLEHALKAGPHSPDRPRPLTSASPASILAPRHADDVAAWLRRLQVVAVVLPVVAILGIHLVRPSLESALGVHRAHLLVGAVSALAVIAFALVMFAVLVRGYQIIVAQSERLARRGQRAAVLGERDRLSREMHDHLAQVIATVHLRLCALPECCDDPQVRQELAEITELCQESYRDVRESILALRVSGTQGLDLLTGLARYAHGCERHTGQQVEIEAPAGALRLDADAEVQALRIIQEALTNVRKHAGTDAATVRIQPVGDEVVIEIVDAGHGFVVGGGGDTLRHFGLRTMRERAALVGGSLDVTSRPGAGTTVRLVLPAAGAATVGNGVGA